LDVIKREKSFLNLIIVHARVKQVKERILYFLGLLEKILSKEDHVQENKEDVLFAKKVIGQINPSLRSMPSSSNCFLI
jgi:hypothetical protein